MEECAKEFEENRVTDILNKLEECGISIKEKQYAFHNGYVTYITADNYTGVTAFATIDKQGNLVLIMDSDSPDSRVGVVLDVEEYSKAETIGIPFMFIGLFGVPVLVALASVYFTKTKCYNWANYLNYCNGDWSRPFDIDHKYDKKGN